MNTVTIKSISWRAVFATALLTGCNTVPAGSVPGGNTGTQNPQPQPTTGVDVTGNWRHAAAGTLRETCFTIQNNRVTRVDDGCNGNILLLASTPSNQGTGSNVTIFVGFAASATDSVNGGLYTYSLQRMSDGTLQGSGVLRFEPNGPILTGNVTWVRQ